MTKPKKPSRPNVYEITDQSLLQLPFLYFNGTVCTVRTVLLNNRELILDWEVLQQMLQVFRQAVVFNSLPGLEPPSTISAAAASELLKRCKLYHLLTLVSMMACL